MSELSRLNFDDDLKAACAAHDAGRWSIVRKGDLEIWVTLAPEDHPDHRYTARLRWTTYPGDLPASVTFVDAGGQLNVPKAWPVAAGFRPPSDICATWTAEGYLAHPEWLRDTSKRWRVDGNALLAQIRTLQQELDISYQGPYRP